MNGVQVLLLCRSPSSDCVFVDGCVLLRRGGSDTGGGAGGGAGARAGAGEGVASSAKGRVCGSAVTEAGPGAPSAGAGDGLTLQQRFLKYRQAKQAEKRMQVCLPR